MDSKKWAPILTPTIFGGFLRHLMSSWQICCRQCDARGEVIEDQTLESAHSNLVPDIIASSLDGWMDGFKIELCMVGYTKDNQCMDGWKDGLLEPCSLELVKHSGTNNQLPAPPALSAVSNHFSSPPTYFPHFPPWLLFVFLTCECETELPPLPPPAGMDQLGHWPRPIFKKVSWEC